MKKLYLLSILFLLFPCVVFAGEAGDQANSYRYKNGERISRNTLSDKSFSFKAASVDSDAWTKVDGSWRSSDGTTVIPNAIAKGIDVSHHDGDIDWAAVKTKSDIDYVIIRCGYGQDMTEQDDRKWDRNIEGVEEQNIPYGVYLYSYATSVAKAEGEANHVLRLVKGHSPDFPIYYDLEDDSILENTSAEDRCNIAKAFCSKIEEAGYNVGIYANKDWFTDYLPEETFDQWTRWCAQWNTACNYKRRYDMWQASSTASVGGIDGDVDVSFLLNSMPGQSVIRSLTTDSDTVIVTWDKSLNTITSLDTRLRKTLDTEIQYSQNSNFSDAQTVTAGSNNTLEQNQKITGLKNGVYYFRVRTKWRLSTGIIYGIYSQTSSVSVCNPVDNQGNKPAEDTSQSSGDSSSASEKKVSITLLKPVITYGKSKKKKSVIIKWNKKNSGKTGLIIEYAMNKKFSGKKVKTVKSSKKQTGVYTLKKLKQKKKYYIRIKVRKIVNGKAYYSKYSKVKTVVSK